MPEWPAEPPNLFFRCLDVCLASGFVLSDFFLFLGQSLEMYTACLHQKRRHPAHIGNTCVQRWWCHWISCSWPTDISRTMSAHIQIIPNELLNTCDLLYREIYWCLLFSRGSFHIWKLVIKSCWLPEGWAQMPRLLQLYPASRWAPFPLP